MRTHLFAAVLWLVPAAALAQQQEQPPPEEQEEGVIEAEGDLEEGEGEVEGAGADVAPQQGDRVRTGPRAGEPAAPGQVHTVVPGDTLWDLSQSYLGSPWYWPKVWSYNPEIANPHWIYPGNLIRFFPGGDEAPVQVEVPTQVQGGDLMPQETGEVAGPDMMESGGTVTASGRIGYAPPNAQRLLLQGFVTARELEEAGKIAGSFAETLMLSYPETLYVEFKKRGTVQVGGEYVIFKTVKAVDHPVKGGRVGYLTHFLGKAKVVKVGEKLVTAQITATWDEIHRGDLIGPLNESLMLEVAARPNEREMQGFIVEMMVPYLTIAGEHQIVLVDKGSSDGVQMGNAFTVIRQQDLGGNVLDPVRAQDKKWPEEAIATCLAVDVKDRASTCLLTRSIREVGRGDRVVMRVGGGAASASAR